jgi:chromosome segregation protein
MLKRLVLSGFKSFAAKTEFVFEPGLSAIVGPNGCGKSNVVDAVKWVLGEQSPRSLRGSEMQDVIFAGSPSRTAAGCAEASLAFDNHGRRLPSDRDEVVVTRRLYRSGDSEYLLDGEPCRLRDIRELILDTGIGRNAYSVIEQGRVDQLLQANPVDRRGIFEDAAGISKYKVHRLAAEHKLTRVDENLLRLADIIGEVERQLRSIRYQAAKARRYREYADRLRELRLAQAARDYTSHHGRRHELHGLIEAASERTIAFAGQLRRLEANQSAAETTLLELEQELSRGRSASVDLRTRASRAEQAITLTAHRLEELTLEEATRTEQCERLGQTITALQEDLHKAEEQGLALRERLLAVGNDLGRTKEDRDLLTVRRHTLEGELQAQRAAILALTQELTQRENDRRSLEVEEAGLGRDRERLQGRRQELLGELQTLGRQEQELQQVSHQGRLEQQELTARRQQLERDLGDLQEESRRLRSELELLRREEASKRSRLRLLAELEANLEGVDAAVRKVLARGHPPVGGHPADGPAAVHGIVAQLLATQPEYSAPVDAALGLTAQAVVTSSLAEALAMREHLAEEGTGRVQFLPLDRIAGAPARPTDGFSTGGRVVGWLADLVTSADPYRPLVASLLGSVLLVEDITAALQLQLELTQPLRLVTRSGELVEPDGRLVLGSGQAGSGLVSRRSQMTALEQELRRLEGDLADREADLADREARQRELEGTRQQLLGDLARAEERLRRATLTLDQLTRRRASIVEEERVLTSELEEVAKALSALQERRGRLAEEVAALTLQRNEREEAVAGRAQELRRVEGEEAVLEQRTTELKVALAQVEEQHASLEVTAANLKKSLHERAEERHYTETHLEICRQRQATAEQELEQTRKTLAESEQQLAALEEHVTGLERRREELRQELAANNEQAKKVRADLDAEQNELQKLELADSELRLKEENLCQRIAEEYQVALTEHLEELLAPERDWTTLAEEVTQLREKVARLGNVNLDAINEEEALTERAAFLRTQQEDLLQSKATLERVIARINQRSRELFLETFQAVRAQFQELFRKLFGGGRADVFLADESDVLGSGIEIVAKPPGKEPRTISLLSGGEKSMTAAAILFAIFRSKPSPFCILDEVDAALDENNVERFLTVLRDFLQESQFIVITHCKRTMAEADVIYGITMQEPGVSTRVAVKLEEAEVLVA